MEKRYVAFIEGLELLDIFLGSSSFKRHAFPDPDKYPEVKASLAPGKTVFNQTETELHVDQEISFLLEEIAKGRKKTRKIFELGGVFTLVYKTKTPMDDEMFEMFKKSNIPVNLHPYMRELIHNTMTRAGMPSFTLPVLKIKR